MREQHTTERLHLLLLIWVFGILSLYATPAAAQYDPLTPFVSWSPDGTMLAVSHNTAVTIFNASTMTLLNSFTNLEWQHVAPTWSPDGMRLAVVNLYDLQIWQQPWSSAAAQQSFIYRYYDRYNPPNPASPINHIAWSPNGTAIAIAHGEVIDVADAVTGTFLREISGEWGYITNFDWYVDDRFALSANFGRIGYVVDAITGGILNYFYTGGFSTESSDVRSVAFSSDRNSLAVGTSDGIIALWANTEAAPIDNEIPDLLFGNFGDQRHSQGVNTLDWSPTGQYVASGGQDGTIRIWDASTGEQLQMINLGEDAWVYSVAWSPDGSRLAYGNPDGSVTLFNATQLPGYAPTPTAILMPTATSTETQAPT